MQTPPTIVIGDIHGSTYWQKVVVENPNCKYIFLGDYIDPYDFSELYEPLSGYTQVVGHNRVSDIREHTNNGGRVIFCDCLFNEKYLKLEF